MREIGVGITLLPHAMRELALLGLQEPLEAAGIENLESVFFNRWGQFIYREPRGRHARLRLAGDRSASRQAARDHVSRRARATGASRESTSTIAAWASSRTRSTPSWASRRRRRAAAAGGSRHRRRLRRREFGGAPRVLSRPRSSHSAASTRGAASPCTSRSSPARATMRIGSIDTGKMVIYPIADNVDGRGNQLVNWVAEIRREGSAMNDWNQPGRPADCIGIFKDWRFDWLDVPATDRGAGDDLRIPDGRQGPGAALDLRPRHAAGRRRAPDVSARLQRVGAGDHRRARAGRTARVVEGRRSGRWSEYERRRLPADGAHRRDQPHRAARLHHHESGRAHRRPALPASSKT